MRTYRWPEEADPTTELDVLGPERTFSEEAVINDPVTPVTVLK